MTPAKPPAEPIVRLSLSISPDLRDRARKAADKEGISISEWIRRAMTRQLDAQP